MMHSFLMIYNTMGSKVDGLAVREHYLSKNALKTAILADTILDHLTLERASTNNFKDKTFSTCASESMEQKLSDEPWADLLGSKLSDWQPLEIFSEWTRKIAKNGVFC